MLTQKMLTAIDVELSKYPATQRRSALMAALRIVQTESRWLSTEAIEAVAQYIGVPAVAAYEVASFYNMYDLKPVGKYKLAVCTNLPCALSGGQDAGEYLKKKLGIDFGQTTADGKFTLVEGECMGACGYAPVMLVNNHSMCRGMSHQAIDQKLAELK